MDKKIFNKKPSQKSFSHNISILLIFSYETSILLIFFSIRYSNVVNFFKETEYA